MDTPLYRFCGEKSGTVSHVVTGCQMLAQKGIIMEAIEEAIEEAIAMSANWKG